MDNQDNRESGTEKSPTEIFIGARDLKKEVYNILPTFDLLLKQIEQIRELSRAEVGKLPGRNYRKDVNNTIGIFGPRGTGKTSVLFTLINKLNPETSNSCTSDISQNMVLGIVEPDHFGDNTRIMGSIVGLLKRIVEHQLKKIEKLEMCDSTEFNDYFNKGMFRSNNPLQTKMNELIEYHMYTENEYRQLLIHTYDDLATHIKKSARLLTPDIEFREKLHQLITCLITNQRVLLKNFEEPSYDCEQEPLLFLFIDDIDLKMTRSRELIEAILQYANHPNVVTVLSGDYEILRDAISLALIQDEGLQHSNLSVHYKLNSEESIKQRKQTLAHEYVKKIIPPARRHQLLQWNENTIPKFSFGKLTFISQLDKLFGHKTLFGYKKNGEELLLPITKSYSIFDRTPRGIINVYYHIHEINMRFTGLRRSGKELSDEEKKEWFIVVKSLVDTILLSSTRLASVQRPVLEKYIQWGHDASSTFLDYSEVEMIVIAESERSSTKQEETVLLPLIIIGEVIHSLLENVRFDKNECARLQTKVLRSILKLEDSANRQKNLHGNIVTWLLDLIRFEHALFFTQLLSENKDWLIQGSGGGEEQSTQWKEKRDQWLLVQINALLEKGREEDLLIRLYYDQYVHSRQFGSRLSEAGALLEYLSEASTSRGNFVYYKSLYEYPLGSQLWDQLKTWIEKKDNLVELFVNLIIELHQQGNTIVEDAMKNQRVNTDEPSKTHSPPASRLKKTVINLQKKQQENATFKLTPTQINRINNLIDQFYETLFSRLRSRNEEVGICWKDEKLLDNGLNDFLKGNCGITKTTKYYQAKVQVRQLRDGLGSYFNFRECRNVVERLASNYAVWYGRMQANALLQVLSEQAYLAPANLEPDELWVLQHLDFYLKQVNDEVNVDESYEKLKGGIRQKLDQGFKAAMELVVTDLSAIGIELDEDEDTDGDA
ncbi:hypothetical protein M5X04_08300 [Paenibacillus alvei]|uniref:AAA+ ATPase domain-containing protein n=1 Tax=Paenibacillus alvei TaxID=44250 RepID=A0ABT4E6G8_PAEAL|nr:P-loop NTPase fold protein [Paenibacillus alvei]MCY9529331.1 hypothetical protein [Paenibacillus alvei]